MNCFPTINDYITVKISTAAATIIKSETTDTIIVFVMLVAMLPVKSVEAAEISEPLVSIDFAQGAGDVVLTGAEIVNDSTRGNVLKLNGGNSRTSYATYTTDVFQNTNNDWTNGMTISAWIQTAAAATFHCFRRQG